MKEFIVKLSGGRYTLVQDELLGMTSKGHPFIWVTGAIDGKEELDTWIHETVHTSLPNASEEQVVRIANDIAEVLWKVGYRRQLKKPKKRRAAKPRRNPKKNT